MLFSKQIFLISFVLLLSTHLFSQAKNNVGAGIVIDKSSGQPVEFATVQLLWQTDSGIVSTTVSDKKGKFIFSGIFAGIYILRSSFTGFENTNSTITIDQQKQNPGIIELSRAITNMNDVVVTAP